MNRLSRRALAWAGIVGLAIGVAACVGGPAARPVVALYDLGDVNEKGEGSPITAPLWLGNLELSAPSWLDSRAMQYRLESEPARRQSFAENRWAATPAELLSAALRRQLGVSGAGCRLKLELDEWIQTFDAAGQSRAQLAVRASLMAAKGDAVLARQSWLKEQPAGRDPRQGVAAFAALERTLAADLALWLASQEKAQKDLSARCRP